MIVVALTATVSGCALVLGLEDHELVVSVNDAGSDREPAVDAADAAGEGPDCAPPSCEGRCDNLVATCGALTLGAECGSCLEGRVCNLMSRTCECPSPCGANTCGTFANACDASTTCGACEAGTSCQSQPDSGGLLACAVGACEAPTAGETCAGGRCSVVTNSCGQAVDCGPCADQLCVDQTCACPPQDRVIDRWFNNVTKLHCVAVPGTNAKCQSPIYQKRIAKIYSGVAGANLDRNLYRCTTATGVTFLSTDGANCEGNNGDKIFVGKCMSRPVCGAVPLRRLRNATGDVIETTDPNENPNGYTFKSSPCFVWPP